MSKVDAMIYKEWHVKRFSMLIDDAQLEDGADDVLPENRKQDNTKKLWNKYLFTPKNCKKNQNVDRMSYDDMICFG